MANPTDPIVVVGGGLAGLAAAATVARSGAPVMVFEKASAAGGRAATQVRDGVALNQGPHALYRGGAGMAVLRDLGIEPRGGVPNASGGHAVRDGRLHALPGGPVSLLTTSLLPLGGKLELARLLGSLGTLDAAALADVSVNAWLARAVRHSRVRELVAALIRLATYANDPERLSAGLAIAQVQLALRENVLYLDGGWQTLVDGLRAAAERAGARITAQARVTRLEQHDGTARAVVTADGARHAARAVILATGPQAALALLGEAADRELAAFVRGTVPLEVACLDVVLAELPRPRSTFALGIDRPLYCSVHSAAARLAPAGRAVIQLAKYLPPSQPADAAADERELEALLDLVQPGWRRHLVQRRFLPHMAAASTSATAERGGLRGRPAAMASGVRGVYLAGDWIGGDGWLADASLASARAAANAVVAAVAVTRPAAA